MKFYEYPTIYQTWRAIGRVPESMSAADFYREILSGIEPQLRGAIFAERDWLSERRPYYNVYPLVCDALLRVPLDLDCGLVSLPLPVFSVRFAVDSGSPIHTVLAMRSVARKRLSDATDSPSLILCVDQGETTDDGLAECSASVMDMTPGHTVEAAVAMSLSSDFSKISFSATPDIIAIASRVVCGVALMAGDPDLIVPDVLERDRLRYADHPDPQTLIDRAHRRGKIGWTIGANLSVDPHYRRPHFGLRWTGAGRKVPRIVPVKGCVVKRSTLTAVPQGRQDDEICPVCGSYRDPTTHICASCIDRQRRQSAAAVEASQLDKELHDRLDKDD